MSNCDNELLTLGWREWVNLPQLGLDRIKAKVDTGARTSSLHAFEIRDFEDAGVQRVEFKMHPNQHDNNTVVVCVADIVDERLVRDSGGHQEKRWIIESPLTIGTITWNIEINLTSRDDMRFRMLLGRTALRGRALVDPARSYVMGKQRRNKKKDKK
ncbi:MAG: ATP-dependent zinc protease [Gammaproteobacteria bacterium]|nr:ATP-dependent zinc protease [Gammaproteobacteria bacterium]